MTFRIRTCLLFEELVVNAKVAGVMFTYNAFCSEPCCASDILMNDILRNHWQFTGYVTSDCWAIDEFLKIIKPTWMLPAPLPTR